MTSRNIHKKYRLAESNDGIMLSLMTMYNDAERAIDSEEIDHVEWRSSSFSSTKSPRIWSVDDLFRRRNSASPCTQRRVMSITYNCSILNNKIKISTHVPHRWNRIDITELVLFNPDEWLSIWQEFKSKKAKFKKEKGKHRIKYEVMSMLSFYSRLLYTWQKTEGVCVFNIQWDT